MTDIYVDGDACPVKDEVYRVAQRYGLRVLLVSNSWLRAPNEEWLELVVVGEELDAADAWIVEHVTKDDIVVTADIPLAALCLEKGAQQADRNPQRSRPLIGLRHRAGPGGSDRREEEGSLGLRKR